MHGAGNAFIVIDGINQHFNLTKDNIKKLSDPNTGIGFDQCLIIEKNLNNQQSFFYRIFNADGSEIGQCGNGARAVALFLTHKNFTNQKSITLQTITTSLKAIVHNNNDITIDMGTPNFLPEKIPFKSSIEQKLQSLRLGNQLIEFIPVSIGNPHAVINGKNFNTEMINEIGLKLSTHELFPEHTNVGFMQINSTNHINLRVYERGTGETQACGSGAVAAVAVGALFHNLAEKVQVSMPGGDLLVNWPNKKDEIFLTGSAEFVYEGTIL